MKRHLLTAAILARADRSLLVLASEALGIRLYDRIATKLCISLVLVLGLQLFMGNSGILSFAHIGFMGVGAYTSAVLTIPVADEGHGAAGPLSVPAGRRSSRPISAIAGGGLGRGGGRGGRVLSADAALGRRGGHHLLRAAGRALHGDDQLERDHQRAAHAVRPAAGDGPPARGAAWRSLALVVALAFKESRTGGLLRASRDDERAAASIGAHIPALRWRAFVLAALFAGVGGALWGHFITSFSPKAFYLKETFLILVDAGDRRRQHGDRRGGRHLHRHRRL